MEENNRFIPDEDMEQVTGGLYLDRNFPWRMSILFIHMTTGETSNFHSYYRSKEDAQRAAEKMYESWGKRGYTHRNTIIYNAVEKYEREKAEASD